MEEPSFEHSSLEESSFEQSSFEKRSFDQSSLKESSFEQSSLEESSLEPNSFEDSSFRDSSFQEDSLDKTSFKSTALRTELPQLQRRTSTPELPELERTALHTELAQLEHRALEKAASSLELSPAQLCSREGSFSLFLGGSSSERSCCRGGVLRAQLPLRQLDLDKLEPDMDVWLKSCSQRLQKDAASSKLSIFGFSFSYFPGEGLGRPKPIFFLIFSLFFGPEARNLFCSKPTGSQLSM